MRIRLFVILIFLVKVGLAQSISVSGSWNPVINTNVLTEAGTDYPSSYVLESASNQSNISLTLGGSFFNTLFNTWRVDVQKSDIFWDSRLIVEIRRTSNGAGSLFSSISGGTVYQPVKQNAQTFFQGDGTFNNIGIQYKISGMSILIPVNTYSTSIFFTLIDI